MILNEETNDFSALIAPRYSTRTFINREVPARILEVILEDMITAPSWSNTRVFRLVLAVGECAQRLHKHYGHLFGGEIGAHVRKVEDPIVEIPIPDGDCPVRKRYPDELRPAQTEVTKLFYGTYGAERDNIKGHNRINRRNVTAFDAPIMGPMFVHEDIPPQSAIDAGLMFQTLFLSAKPRGVDPRPVGILVTWREPVDAEFETPEHYRFTADLTFGYVDPKAPTSTMRVPRPLIQLLDGKRCYE